MRIAASAARRVKWNASIGAVSFCDGRRDTPSSVPRSYTDWRPFRMRPEPKYVSLKSAESMGAAQLERVGSLNNLSIS